MLTNRKALWAVLAILTVGFVYGIAQLFALRFEAGDVYPPYSSLRSDPLGAKALYESLESLPNIKAQRLCEPLYKVETGRDRTLFILGTSHYELTSVSEKEYKEFDTFLRSGGRVVIALFPAADKNYSARKREKDLEDKENEKDQESKKNKKPTKFDKAKEKDKENEEFGYSSVSLLEKWGFKMDYRPLEVDEEGVSLPVQVIQAGNEELPKSFSWHSAIYFCNLDKAWNAVYSRGSNAVIMERSFGKGSLVLCSDSYVSSNEALRKEPNPGLIAWLVGSSRQVLFDETHLGVEDNPSIAMLLRKYHLQGLVLGLLGLAGLFVWKNASSFVPPDEEADGLRSAPVIGKDSASGFANLLRRNISQSEILAVCVSEWKKTRLRQRLDLNAKDQQIDAILSEQNARPARERNSAQAYQAIATLLKNERKS